MVTEERRSNSANAYRQPSKSEEQDREEEGSSPRNSSVTHNERAGAGGRVEERKEVLKVNRIAATESYCRGQRKVEEERRHWTTRRRAEAIYSIHGRANTNLRLDVQTAPGSLPLLLSPSYSLHLFPAVSLPSPPPPLPVSPPYHSPPSTTSSSRSASYSSSRRNTSPARHFPPSDLHHLPQPLPLYVCTSRERIYVSRMDETRHLWTLTSSRFDRR